MTACGETVPETQETEAPTVPDGVVAVGTVEELQNAFSRLKSEDVIWLTADLDMTGQDLAVVNVRSFTLEGNGHTIRNYSVQGKSGLFVDNGGDRFYTFRDLTLENCSVESDDEFAITFERTAKRVVFSPLLFMFASRILSPYISAVSLLAIAPSDLSPFSATAFAAAAVLFASSASKPRNSM